MSQLRLDGSEVPASAQPAQAPLTPPQREILRLLAERGSIHSVEAGEIVHACRHGTSKPGYWSSDGCDALKRLAKRGLVRRGPGRGEWVAA